MADENKEGATEGAEGEEEQAPKKKLPLGMIALVLQLVVMLAGAGLIVKGTLLKPKPDFTKKKMVERTLASVRDVTEDIQLMELERFVVNVSNSHKISAKIQVEVSNPDVLALLSRRLPSVKQRVLDVLSRRAPEGLKTLKSKLRMKEAIRRTLNEELVKNGHLEGIVRDIYFSELIVI